MRRTIAGTAATLLAALAIGGPLAPTADAGSTSVQCGATASSTECELLDQLAAQLSPIAPLLGTVLAPLTSQAQGLAAESDQAGGVPTAEALAVSRSLLDQLGALPASVQTLVGTTRLGALTDTLEALIGALTAPAAPPQQQASGPTATPAKTQTSSPVSAPLADSTRSTGSSSPSAPAAPGGSTSRDSVPNVPVGNPLTLAPLALPEFGFDPSFAPAATADATTPAATALEVALADAADGQSRAAEVAVAALLSVLLLAAAGIAQLQANRHQIPD